MRLTLATAALLAVSGAALAQGTATQPSTAVPPATATQPSTAVPPATATTPAGTAGGQTPSAAVNTTPATSSPRPSAVQTTNTTHRTAAAPVPGRNSFTQGEAVRRITAAGYTKVTGMQKDRQGIWRGRADKDGSSVAVSLDYQGNVNSQ